MTIKLKRDDGVLVPFGFQRAEALLRGEAKMKHGVWELPADSKYQFVNNGLIRRANKGTSGSETKRGTSGQSKKTRKPTDDAQPVDSKQE